MLYVIECRDHEDVVEKRMKAVDAHREYLRSSGVKIVCAGPLLQSDGKTPGGSLFIVDTETQDAAEQFNAADPLRELGIWRDTRITPFAMVIDNRA